MPYFPGCFINNYQSTNGHNLEIIFPLKLEKQLIAIYQTETKQLILHFHDDLLSFLLLWAPFGADQRHLSPSKRKRHTDILAKFLEGQLGIERSGPTDTEG